MSARAASFTLAVGLVSACSYDLDVLKGRRVDASVDRTPPVDTAVDTVVVDRATPPDAPADVTVIDTGPPRAPMTGVCTVMGAMVETPPAATNGITIITGTTMGGGANGLTPMCTTGTSPNSTRIYRYVVQSGPRLVASTNTGLCGAHDTVLAAYFSCDATGGRPVGSMNCNDDDGVNLCAGCPDMGMDAGVAGGCGPVHSTLELTNLVQNDVIYFVVTSYAESAIMPPHSAFRLVIAENGLAPTATTMVDGGLRGVNRCACPPPGAVMSREVAFPSASMSDQNQLATASHSVFGARVPPLGQIVGVSGRLRLSRYNVSMSGMCAVSGGAKAALDLSIGTTVIASVSLGTSVGDPGFVTIPFTTFAPLTVSTTAMTTFQYQVRNVEPATVPCVTLDVDLNASNIVTLYGS